MQIPARLKVTVATRPGCWIIWIHYISHMNQLNLRLIFDQSFFFFLVCDEWVFFFSLYLFTFSTSGKIHQMLCLHPVVTLHSAKTLNWFYLWAIHGSHVTAVCVLCDQLLTEETLNHCLNEAYLHTRGWHFAQHSQSEYIPMSVEQPSLLSPPLFHSLCGWDTLKKKKKRKPNLHDFSAAKAVQSLYGSGPMSLEQKGCTVCVSEFIMDPGSLPHLKQDGKLSVTLQYPVVDSKTRKAFMVPFFCSVPLTWISVEEQRQRWVSLKMNQVFSQRCQCQWAAVASELFLNKTDCTSHTISLKHLQLFAQGVKCWWEQ